MNCFKGVSPFALKCLRFVSKSSANNIYSSALSSDELSVQTLEGQYEGIVVLGLNRPLASNALGSRLTSSLINVVNKIQFDSNARVVIFRSLVPGVFCAGADLKERAKMSNSEVRDTVLRLNTLATSIENIPIPTIAAIDGAALGGGLEITLGCDIRTVSDNAKLGLVETKWAIMPAAGGSQRLPRLINLAVAKELIFSAKVIDGNEAKSIGLANHVSKQNSSSDAAYQKSLDIAHKILVNGPLGIKMAKLSIQLGQTVDINSACAIEQLCYANLIPTKDRIEGLMAFKEKRNPKYEGK